MHQPRARISNDVKIFLEFSSVKYGANIINRHDMGFCMGKKERKKKRKKKRERVKTKETKKERKEREREKTNCIKIRKER